MSRSFRSPKISLAYFRNAQKVDRSSRRAEEGRRLRLPLLHSAQRGHAGPERELPQGTPAAAHPPAPAVPPDAHVPTWGHSGLQALLDSTNLPPRSSVSTFHFCSNYLLLSVFFASCPPFLSVFCPFYSLFVFCSRICVFSVSEFFRIFNSDSNTIKNIANLGKVDSFSTYHRPMVVFLACAIAFSVVMYVPIDNTVI